MEFYSQDYVQASSLQHPDIITMTIKERSDEVKEKRATDFELTHPFKEARQELKRITGSYVR